MGDILVQFLKFPLTVVLREYNISGSMLRSDIWQLRCVVPGIELGPTAYRQVLTLYIGLQLALLLALHSVITTGSA